MPGFPDTVTSFIKAACVPLQAHASGTLDQAQAIRAANLAVTRADIYAAAVFGDAAVVREFLRADPALATAKGGPYHWDPLTYLCFSRYLRLDRARAPEFLAAAQALLDAGASARTGFYSAEHQPQPEFESVLYGVAGVAHDAALTQLLLDHGADPNGGEVAYHSPETCDNAAMKVLAGTGWLTTETLATMLLRKADWHDRAGVQFLLEHGADPNFMSPWGRTALHQAVLRDNALAIIELMLDHGADPTLTARNIPGVVASSSSAVALAARRGRGDLLEALQRRNVPIQLDALDQLLAACARHDAAAVRALAQPQSHVLDLLRADAGKVLAQFAGNGNTEGVRLLLDLGLDVDGRFREGDGYFQIAPQSTPLHVAAWRAQHATVKLLLARGADVNARDAQGRTPLALAVRACVDSHWMHRRSPDSVAALLHAGASPRGITVPTGYPAIDDLFRSHIY